jgi:drug/metabolite transporter (DMT)-like permease
MLFATFFFSTMNVFVKFVPHIPAVEIVFFRSLISLALSYGILKSRNNFSWGSNRKVLILRGVTGAIALILYFKTLQHIPLASAVTIQFLAPIFTTILGIFIVKERVFPLQWLFFLLSFGGVLVIQGFDTRISNILLLMGLGASLSSGLAHNFIRKLNTSEDPLVIVLYFPLVTLPVTGMLSIFDWVMPSGEDLLILLAIGLLTQVAQVLLTKAIQHEELSRVSSLRYLSIIYALIYGFLLFDEHFNLFTYLGMALTLSGVVLNFYYKSKMEKRLKILQKV